MYEQITIFANEILQALKSENADFFATAINKEKTNLVILGQSELTSFESPTAGNMDSLMENSQYKT